MADTSNTITFEEQFRAHADELHRTTCFLSFHKYDHPSYLAIVRMGKGVIPLMLKDLQDENWEAPTWYWFGGLRELTGEWPFTKKDAGRYERFRTGWVRWGIEHGYLQGELIPPPKTLFEKFGELLRKFAGM